VVLSRRRGVTARTARLGDLGGTARRPIFPSAIEGTSRSRHVELVARSLRLQMGGRAITYPAEQLERIAADNKKKIAGNAPVRNRCAFAIPLVEPTRTRCAKRDPSVLRSNLVTAPPPVFLPAVPLRERGGRNQGRTVPLWIDAPRSP